MTSEDWPRVEELFHAASQLGAAERDAFLARECAGDTALRREVESLLAALDRSGDFIETPAIAVAAKNFAEGQVASTVGRKIGGYEIVSLVGAGGMGEVYLARDAKLGRKVALKILPAHFEGDDELVRRFELEARAVCNFLEGRRG